MSVPRLRSLVAATSRTPPQTRHSSPYVALTVPFRRKYSDAPLFLIVSMRVICFYYGGVYFCLMNHNSELLITEDDADQLMCLRSASLSENVEPTFRRRITLRKTCCVPALNSEGDMSRIQLPFVLLYYLERKSPFQTTFQQWSWPMKRGLATKRCWRTTASWKMTCISDADRKQSSTWSA